MQNPSIVQQKDNTLPSHTKYSCPFSKTPRFPDRNSNCPEAFYSYDSQLSNRKTSLGYGKKTDFAALLPRTPASSQYRIRSEFDRPRGVSFGSARDRSPDKSYLIPQLQKHPGVGRYENQVKTRMYQEYSLKSKTLDVIEKDKMSNHTPGPGAYDSSDFEVAKLRHGQSKYTDSKFGTIEPHRKRFPDINVSPGPSSYINEGGQLATNHCTLSSHADQGARVFSKQARFTGVCWSRSKNPGPMDYNVPTEFGKTQSNFHNF